MFTMLVLALYTMVDNIFIARYVGGDALGAVNIVFPFISFMFGVVIMIAVGGATIVSILMGEGKKREADEKFTLIVLVTVIFSLVISVAGLAFLKPLVRLLGATDRLAPYGETYLGVQLWFFVLFMPKIAFEYLLRADGAPGAAFRITLIGGVANVVLDYIFIALMGMGVAGAALGTGIAGSFSCLLSAGHFLTRRSFLKFRKPRWDFSFLVNTCVNGSSEMVNEWSGGITTFLFNIIVLRYLGEAGVAAISALLLMNFVLLSLLLGAGMGFSPLISYLHGAGDAGMKRRIAGMSLGVMLFLSLLSFLFSSAGGGLLAELFDSSGEGYGVILENALDLFCFAFLFNGFNIFVSNLFTALNNGRVSAGIALMRSLVGVVTGLLVLPGLLGETGIWLAVPFAEGLTMILSVWMLLRLRKSHEPAPAVIPEREAAAV